MSLTGQTRFRPLQVKHPFRPDDIVLVLQVEEHVTREPFAPDSTHWRDAKVEDLAYFKEIKP